MSEMVERMAKALHKAHYERGRGIPPGWPADRFEREMWFFSARAAIEVMREPTSAMMDAGCKDPISHCWGSGGEFTDAESAGFIWQAMIDEALK